MRHRGWSASDNCLKPLYLTSERADCAQLVYTGLAAIESLNTIDERRSKIVRNIVFDCHLSPGWRQMAIENTVSSIFFCVHRLLRAFSIAAYPACSRATIDSFFLLSKSALREGSIKSRYSNGTKALIF